MIWQQQLLTAVYGGHFLPYMPMPRRRPNIAKETKPRDVCLRLIVDKGQKALLKKSNWPIDIALIGFLKFYINETKAKLKF